MTRLVFILVVVSLGACDTPSPEFRGVVPMRIRIGQSMFDVRVKDRRAEAIRLNPEWAPRPGAVAPRGVAAIEVVSGCRVRRLRGDQAMMVGDLDCGGPLRSLPVPRPAYMDCGVLDLDEEYADLICTPVYP